MAARSLSVVQQMYLSLEVLRVPISVYVKSHSGQPGESELNMMPTVVFEYGHSETSHKLALDAVHHLLLSQGLVQLVIAVDVKRKSDAQDGLIVLEKVTWAHWEVDGNSFEEVDSFWRGDLDDPQPDRDIDEDFVQLPADALSGNRDG